jgi:ABC-type transporter Mla MlaB component
MSDQIEVFRSGEWLPADEMLGNILVALEHSSDLSIDLEGVAYIDASSLQILLGLAAEQQRAGSALQLMHASASLLEWLDCAGATPYLQHTWNGNA